jgi:hypothetical protein
MDTAKKFRGGRPVGTTKFTPEEAAVRNRLSKYAYRARRVAAPDGAEFLAALSVTRTYRYYYSGERERILVEEGRHKTPSAVEKTAARKNAALLEYEKYLANKKKPWALSKDARAQRAVPPPQEDTHEEDGREASGRRQQAD